VKFLGWTLEGREEGGVSDREEWPGYIFAVDSSGFDDGEVVKGFAI